MSINLNESDLKAAKSLVAETEANGGLAPLDLERFWAAEDDATVDPWRSSQVKLGIRMSHECVFAELGEPEDWYRLQHDAEYRCGLCRKYNDRAEKIVGRRLLNESPPDPGKKWPRTKALHDIFEAENSWQNDSYWLHQAASDPNSLASLLDRVEQRLENLREFILPPNWAEEKARLNALGINPPRYRGQRGPVTFAMSIYGVENLIFLIMDQPDLAARFRDTILRAMLEMARILDEEAGDSPESAPRGFSFCDDNCAMLNPEMYEFFGWPILKSVFDVYAPNPEDWRFQHSDSDMAQLLPLLGKLGLKAVNFGPNLSVCEIRKHCPQAIIQGQLAPFTFSRNEKINIVAEYLRDARMARENKGLSFSTAGSINNGSRLSGMRLIMAAIQRWPWGI